jgi:hypothetical protein
MLPRQKFRMVHKPHMTADSAAGYPARPGVVLPFTNHSAIHSSAEVFPDAIGFGEIFRISFCNRLRQNHSLKHAYGLETQDFWQRFRRDLFCLAG